MARDTASGPLDSRRVDINYAHARRTGVELRAVTLELDGERMYSRRLPEGVEAFAPTELYDGPATAGEHQMRFVAEWEFRYFGATCHYGAPKHARTVTVHRFRVGNEPVSVCVRTGSDSVLEPVLESIEPRIEEGGACAGSGHGGVGRHRGASAQGALARRGGHAVPW